MPDLAVIEEIISEELKPVAETFGKTGFLLKKQENGRFGFLYCPERAVIFGFTLDFPEKLIMDGAFFLEGHAVGIGLGRKLVEMQESVCKKAGMKTIVINQNWNSPFWKHMGYKIMGPRDILKFYFKDVHFKFDQYWPRYKMLD